MVWWCGGHRNHSRLRLRHQISWFDSVYGYCVLRAILVYGDGLYLSSQGTVGFLIRLLQGASDSVHPHEDVGAGVQVLADECSPL